MDLCKGSRRTNLLCNDAEEFGKGAFYEVVNFEKFASK